MSASLVGSEMCIRDSPGTAPWHNARGKPPAPQLALEPRNRPQPYLSLLSCLLYTSDAADDM
eukprot:15386946-Alexandrium_andersonii.AAC.1